VDLNTTFRFDLFCSFKFLVGSSHDLFIMKRILNLNTSIEHLAFDYNKHIWVKHLNQLTWVVSFVITNMHIQIVEIVKN
jgi:hypothetical protein